MHVVLGLGVTGRAVAEFLLDRNEKVVGIEKNLNEKHKALLDKGLKVFGEGDFTPLEKGGTLHLSPGIPHTHPVVKEAKRLLMSLIGEIEFALQYCKRPLVGVTGTNGKTTVTLLVDHVLNKCGIPSEPLGNIGMPLISKIDGDKVGVLELSSYQLEEITTRALKGAALLNITPDHLDRYESFQAYAATKFHIQNLLLPDGKFIVERETAKNFQSLIHNTPTIYSAEDPYFLDEGKRNKSHDRENLIAAFLLTQIFGVSEKEFLEAVKSFKKPPHRIEFVRELNGITFWDDSKGTNIDATLRAVEVMEGPVVLIAGGVDKGYPYTSWGIPFKGKVKEVICFGEAKDKIRSDLSGFVPSSTVMSLNEAVQYAYKLGDKGDHVLLSPGCSSFDMFRDYMDRGEQFKSLVRSLS